jgi:hypothetical protein
LVDDSQELVVAILCRFIEQEIIVKRNTPAHSAGIHANVVGVAGKCVVELITRAFRFEGEYVKESEGAKRGGRFGVRGCNWVQGGSKQLNLCRLGTLTAAIVKGYFVYSVAVNNDEVII